MNQVTERLANFSPEKLRQLARRLNKKDATAMQIRRQSRETNSFPLSFAQERLWFLDQLNPGNPAYNMPFAFRLRFPERNLTGKEVDANVLIKLHHGTLNELVRRHEILRTSFPISDGSPVQVVAQASPVPLELIELPDFPEGEREKTAKRIIQEDARKPFDLSHGPLCRFGLIQFAPNDYVGFCTFHHILIDAWSEKILIEEFLSLFFAALSQHSYLLPELPIQYADYAVWQREWLQGDVLDRLRKYWTQQLKGLPDLQFPTDHPRPALQSFCGATESLFLPNSLCDSLRLVGQTRGVTLFATFFAAWLTLLLRYTGETDIAVCVPVANRTHVGIEQVIGFFVNTLVVRVDLSGDPTFAELLKRVWEVCTNAYVHQEMPFAKLIQELQLPRNLGRNALSGIAFQLQDIPTPAGPSIHSSSTSELTVTLLEVNARTSVFDLDFSLRRLQEPEGLRGSLTYSTDLFDAATVHRMLNHFHNLLRAVVKSPDCRLSQLELLSQAEREQLLVEWNATARDYGSPICVQQLFEAQVERTPNAVAVEYELQQMSYAELNGRVNQLAHYLRRLGVGPEVRVAICVERGLEMVIGVLGILKAGGAYVPLDPHEPAERLAYMLKDAEVLALITQDKLRAKLPPRQARTICLDEGWGEIARESNRNPAVITVPQNLVYMIYTSGSTGKPKGAMNVHAGLCNRLLWMQECYELDESDRVLQKTPFTFDVSVWELFWPLTVGARLVMAQPEGHRDAGYLIEAIQRFQITTIHFVPPMLSVWLEDEAVKKCSSLKRVICSGEVLNVEQQRKFQKSLKAELHNLYGPTEASIDVTFWPCPADWGKEFVPIGKPIANTQIYVLDDSMEPVPAGAAGELYIGGAGLARGYLKLPELTADRFVPNPFNAAAGERLYRSGDLARYQADGSLEFLGRIDHQVKIRGFRVELGEIETVLREHAAIQQAVAVVREEKPGEKRLVGYVVKKAGTGELDLIQLRAYLREHLPEYMVPNALKLLESMPLTANGKLDRKALPIAETTSSDSNKSFVAPRTPVEQTLTEIWSEILGAGRIGVHDSFFDLGGHSLLATRVISRVQQTFQVDVPVRSMFEPPTIAALAERIESAMAGHTAVETPLDLAAEAVLDPTIVPKWDTELAPSVSANILLTGATGFLGAFLLSELLHTTQANIYCLVRSLHVQHGSNRIQQQLESFGLWEKGWSARIIPIPGDLSRPLFGLSGTRFNEIAGLIDTIYHSAAVVNFFYPYSAVKSPNVGGTQEILRVASHGRRKPVHFVSSMAVFPRAQLVQTHPNVGGSNQNAVIAEEDSLETWQGLYTGYSQSKWVAERLIGTATSRGIPVAIYRPSIICGHTETGAGNPTDLLFHFLHSCVQLGYTPDMDLDLPMVPVDYVSRAIVALSMQPEAIGRKFHLVTRRTVRLRSLLDCVLSSGIPLHKLSYENWRALLLSAPDNALATVAPFVEYMPEYQVERTIDCRNTQNMLKSTGVRCPEITPGLLRTYVSHLLRKATPG